MNFRDLASKIKPIIAYQDDAIEIVEKNMLYFNHIKLCEPLLDFALFLNDYIQINPSKEITEAIKDIIRMRDTKLGRRLHTHTQNIFKKLQDELKTEEICLENVKKYGQVLKHVPEPLKTEAVCLEAVKKDGRALSYVPEAKRTEALCFAAIRQNGWAFWHVPKALQTESLCLTAVEQYAYVLSIVPEAMKTEAVCLAAVRQAGSMIVWTPEELHTVIIEKAQYGIAE